MSRMKAVRMPAVTAPKPLMESRWFGSGRSRYAEISSDSRRFWRAWVSRTCRTWSDQILGHPSRQRPDRVARRGQQLGDAVVRQVRDRLQLVLAGARQQDRRRAAGDEPQ